MSHDNIKRLNGLKWHDEVLATKHSFQLIQMDLGHMLDANLVEVWMRRGGGAGQGVMGERRKERAGMKMVNK